MSVFVNDNGVEKEAKMIYVNDGGIDKLVAGGVDPGGAQISGVYNFGSGTTVNIPFDHEENSLYILHRGSSPSQTVWNSINNLVGVTVPSVFYTTEDPGSIISGSFSTSSLLVIRNTSGFGHVVARSQSSNSSFIVEGVPNREPGALVLTYFTRSDVPTTPELIRIGLVGTRYRANFGWLPYGWEFDEITITAPSNNPTNTRAVTMEVLPA